jgi:cell division protein FtsB
VNAKAQFLVVRGWVLLRDEEIIIRQNKMHNLKKTANLQHLPKHKTRALISKNKEGIGMKAFSHTLTLLLVNTVSVGLVGCGISKEEHEKVVFHLEQANAQLAKSSAELEQANEKIAKMEKSQTDDAAEVRIAIKKHRRAEKLLRASLVNSQRETTILRQQLDKLTQSLRKASRELDVTKQANEELIRQINELMKEKRRS